MVRAILLTPLLALAVVACGDKDTTGTADDTAETDTDTDTDAGTGGGTGDDGGGDEGGGTGDDGGGDDGGGDGGDDGGGDDGGGDDGGGDEGGGDEGGDEGGDPRDLSPYEGDWSGAITMDAVATDGSGLEDSCSGVLTFTVTPAETTGAPILGEFTCTWAGGLSALGDQVDAPVFAGGTPGLPDVEGVIIYGPFELDWTGTASASEWSGTYAGTYIYDSSIPQLPGMDVSGTWSASPVTR